MSRTTGHVFRRFQGFKSLLAERAALKAAFVADDGADPSDVPFWAEAEDPSPFDCEIEDGDLYDRWSRYDHDWEFYAVLDWAKDCQRDDYDLAWDNAREAEAQKAAWLAGELAA